MGKRYETAVSQVDQTHLYEMKAALALIQQVRYAKFDEAVELAMYLNVDPKRSDHMIRGSVLLPHGTGKQVRVLVFAKGEKEQEAREAGADYVGAEELAEKVTKGWRDFDRVMATPDQMGMVSRLGKILGPRGLMPNPKVGTVTFEIGRAVREAKQGRVEYRMDKTGIVHLAVGKVSFSVEQLLENVLAVVEVVVKARPSTVKGRYLETLSVSSTMGPGVGIDPASAQKLAAA